MKRLCITLSLKEKKAITKEARSLSLSRCTLMHKALCLYTRQMKHRKYIQHKRNRHV